MKKPPPFVKRVSTANVILTILDCILSVDTRIITKQVFPKTCRRNELSFRSELKTETTNPA